MRTFSKKTRTAILYIILLLIFVVGGMFFDSYQSGNEAIGTQNERGSASALDKNNISGKTGQPGNGTALLRVHFIDVGQADSILIQTPGEKVMLIDAGNNADGNAVVSYIKDLGIEKIDVLVGTHPHEDHIGGMDTVINAFPIGDVYMPRASSNTKTFKDVLNAVKSKGLTISPAVAGKDIPLDPSVHVEILAPNSTGYNSLNDYSAVIKVKYKDRSFLFTGDAEKVSEKEMLDKNLDVKADVLKVGHHGSSSSTSSEFLDKVAPKFAVIMVEKGNDYKHPHQEIMERLKNREIPVYRTDQNGNIVVKCDGNDIEFGTQPGDYSYGGDKK